MLRVLVSTGHADAAYPLRAPNLEGGSAVVCLSPASLGSGGRGLPSPSPAEELEARAQQNKRLQHLRNNGSLLLGLLSQNPRVGAAVKHAVSVILNQCVKTHAAASMTSLDMSCLAAQSPLCPWVLL